VKWRYDDPREALCDQDSSVLVIVNGRKEFFKGMVFTCDESWSVWVTTLALHYDNIMPSDPWPSDWAWIQVPFPPDSR